ncbi:MAG: NUDIX domain-containing protein [Oscillospiraceae bacterium]
MKEFFKFDPLLNGSKGLVFIGDKILVYRRDTKPKMYPLYLDFPGGGKEEGETPFDTFQREVEEEFGLIIQQSNIEYVRRYPSTIIEGEFFYFPVARLPKSLETLIVFGDEGLEYFLQTIDDFLSAPDVWPGLQDRAKDYIKSLNSSKFVH